VNASHLLLSGDEVNGFRTNGLLLQERVFSAEEVARLKESAEVELASDSPRRTVEKDSGVARGVHGGHLYRRELAELVKFPRLLLTASRLLEDAVYVYQFKVHAKRSFKGEVWAWHQDFIFWHLEDGMPAARALTAAIFLDEVNEFNGPLVFMPGGHSQGMIDVHADGGGWDNTLTADLKYQLNAETVRRLSESSPLTAPKGPPGSVLWFDCNIPHASAPNMSPFDRRIVLITYNAVSNAPVQPSTRPEWLVGRDCTPLEPRLH
jgi:ectoine hydroxylase